MTARGKIAVLLPNGWLYGTVNRGEFAKAIESERTFRLSKTGWRAGPSVVVVKGSHVAAWDWLTPAPAKRKRAAKPKAARSNGITEGVVFAAAPLTADQRDGLRVELSRLNSEAITMLSIAAGVEAPSELTQATLPAFREALAAHMAGMV
jgi:hypothetical protein